MIHKHPFASLLVCSALLGLVPCGITGCPAEDPDSDNSSVVDTPVSEETETAAQVTTPNYDPPVMDTPVEAATFAFITDFMGFQRPCGCATAQYGGLPRLGTIVQMTSEAMNESETDSLLKYGVSLPPECSGSGAAWLVDCGNFTDPGKLYPELRARTHLASLAAAGAVCAVPGLNEINLSEENAKAVFSRSELPLVSCNLSSGLSEIRLQSYITPAPNWALIGLTSTADARTDGSWWTASDPVRSAADTLDELPKGVNVVICAAGQPDDVILQLLEMPVRAVVTDRPFATFRDTGVLIVSGIPSRGRVIHLASISSEAKGPAVEWLIVSDDSWEDDPAVLSVLETEQKERKERLRQDMASLWGEGGFENIEWGMSGDYLPPDSDPDAGPYYAGHTSCGSCHAAEYEVWEKSAHSHALKSLIDAGENESLDCLQCHTAGLYERTGYNLFSPSEETGAVTCESCHGPGSRHVALMSGDNPTDGDLAIKPGEFESCLTCHDDYNSPSYEQESYWNSIRH